MTRETRLTVLEPGFTTVQDLGRPGYSRLGVGHNGAGDRFAAAAATALVGNPRGTPLFESTATGWSFTLDRPALVAVTGAAEHVTRLAELDAHGRAVLRPDRRERQVPCVPDAERDRRARDEAAGERHHARALHAARDLAIATKPLARRAPPGDDFVRALAVDVGDVEIAFEDRAERFLQFFGAVGERLQRDRSRLENFSRFSFFEIPHRFEIACKIRNFQARLRIV